LGKDPETQVILFYIEGLDDGREFFEASRKITPCKPIIAFKGGKTLAGARAAKSIARHGGVKELYEGLSARPGLFGLQPRRRC